mmetsp:Transcript_21154/g.47569  ORF Transcript_21154/g.47569 Transcript_21154/m.47569 type:complete len:237 (-) Transcript_21154:183-893(-)
MGCVPLSEVADGRDGEALDDHLPPAIQALPYLPHHPLNDGNRKLGMENHVQIEEQLVCAKVKVQWFPLDCLLEKLDGPFFLRLVQLTSDMVEHKRAIRVVFVALKDVEISHVELGADTKSGPLITSSMPPERRHIEPLSRSLYELQGAHFGRQPCYHLWETPRLTERHGVVRFLAGRTPWWVKPPPLHTLLQRQPSCAVLVEGHTITPGPCGDDNHGTAHPLRNSLPALPRCSALL